jgi:hypothetical protein
MMNNIFLRIILKAYENVSSPNLGQKLI